MYTEYKSILSGEAEIATDATIATPNPGIDGCLLCSKLAYGFYNAIK